LPKRRGGKKGGKERGESVDGSKKKGETGADILDIGEEKPWLIERD